MQCQEKNVVDKEGPLRYVLCMQPLPWQDSLFKTSLMKKEKVHQILRRIDFQGAAVLDLGCSHGTVSLQLKRKGGRWFHADLDMDNLITSRPVLGEALFQSGGAPLPFRDSSFDLLLLLDFLEHVEDDAAVLKEAARVLKTGGRIVISTPHHGNGQILNRIKPKLGLVPAIFGHKRAGYTLPRLSEMLRDHGFGIIRAETYAKFFVEACEMTLNTVYIRKNRGNEPGLRTGSISPQSSSEMDRHGRLIRFYSRWIYPLVYLFTRLDRLLFWKTGYATLVIGEKK